MLVMPRPNLQHMEGFSGDTSWLVQKVSQMQQSWQVTHSANMCNHLNKTSQKKALQSTHVLTCILAATESCEVMQQEVARLQQLNEDVRATCQRLQATVDDSSRYR